MMMMMHLSFWTCVCVHFSNICVFSLFSLSLSLSLSKLTTRASSPILRYSSLCADVKHHQQVIHGPSSALKELLENALDARSTQITILVKDGGKKLLQITDNGCGIREEDAEIVCERHTTSKLEKFEDLECMETFGFRGEALASMTYVADVAITTMREGQKCAWKASYAEGKMKEGSKELCAGVTGTTISVENLFYNVRTRRNALKSGAEEYAKILDVVTRYSASRPDVAFSCRKVGETRATLNAPLVLENNGDDGTGDATGAGEQKKEENESSSKSSSRSAKLQKCRLERIGQIYGPSVSKELLPLRLKTNNEKLEKKTSQFHMECDILYSNANYKAKKTTFILFINGRLVECSQLKRAIEIAYQSVLPSSSREKPFVFLSMKLPFKDVDVNVHPTKREVHFLHQEEIVERVQTALEKALVKSNSARTFTVQTLLPGVQEKLNGKKIHKGEEGEVKEEEEEREEEGLVTRQQKQMTTTTMKTKTTLREKAGGDHKLVRTNPTKDMASLDAFYRKTSVDGTSTAGFIGEGENEHNNRRRSSSTTLLEEVRRNVRARRNRPTKDGSDGAMNDIAPYYTDLTSVTEICESIRQEADEEIAETLRSHTIVGPADVSTGKWLIQHGTKLLMINVNVASRALMYQLAMAKFNGFKRISIEPPARLSDLIEEEEEEEEEEEGKAKGKIEELLLLHAKMLKEYFGIEIEKEAKELTSVEKNVDNGAKEEDVLISALPEILDGHVPDVSRLPEFVKSLHAKVDWSNEKQCFVAVAECLAEFYGVLDDDDDEEEEDNNNNNNNSNNNAEEERKDTTDASTWQTKHVVFPALSSSAFAPPKAFARDGTVVEVARLEQLYKVFERC